MTTLAMIGPLGLPELLVIFAIVVLIFGSSKLPQLGRGLGEGITNFRKGLKGSDNELEEGDAKSSDAKNSGTKDNAD